jgi:ethanolamine utilization microcompartment shell protein EutL
MRFNYLDTERLGVTLPTPTCYDGLLAAMPASIVGGAAAGWLLAIPLAVGVGAGSALAAIFVAVSLFVVPPE